MSYRRAPAQMAATNGGQTINKIKYTDSDRQTAQCVGYDLRENMHERCENWPIFWTTLCPGLTQNSIRLARTTVAKKRCQRLFLDCRPPTNLIVMWQWQLTNKLFKISKISWTPLIWLYIRATMELWDETTSKHIIWLKCHIHCVSKTRHHIFDLNFCKCTPIIKSCNIRLQR